MDTSLTGFQVQNLEQLVAIPIDNFTSKCVPSLNVIYCLPNNVIRLINCVYKLEFCAGSASHCMIVYIHAVSLKVVFVCVCVCVCVCVYVCVIFSQLAMQCTECSYVCVGGKGSVPCVPSLPCVGKDCLDVSEFLVCHQDRDIRMCSCNFGYNNNIVA